MALRHSYFDIEVFEDNSYPSSPSFDRLWSEIAGQGFIEEGGVLCLVLNTQPLLSRQLAEMLQRRTYYWENIYIWNIFT